MDLIEVSPQDYGDKIQETLKTLISDEQLEDLREGLLLELNEGSILYSVIENDEEIGFIIVTPLSDDPEDMDRIDLLSIEDIWIKSGKQSDKVAENIGYELREIGERHNVTQVEVIVSQSISWLNDALQEQGYISSEVKLEKILPKVSNLSDVLELIQGCTPIDRIVQVLLEKEDEFRTEFVESAEEIEEQLDEGWIPVMVVVTFEPDNQNIEQVIEESNQLINWDDFAIVYYI